jgi:hypothetical protein
MAAHFGGHSEKAILIRDCRVAINSCRKNAMTQKTPMLHSTYFDLGVNNTPDVAGAFMADALQYLSISSGMVAFWFGARATDMTRSGNDLKFDLAMHQLFQSEKDFDVYNKNDTSHSQFVADVNRWTPSTTRRVMDTYLSNFVIGGNLLAKQPIGADDNMPQGLFHSIYFALTDKSAGNIKRFTPICVKFLSQHPGILQFDTGTLTDINRDVSVRNFDVAVDIVYESKAAYDLYLHSKEHDAFFPATEGMIAGTYIFDSYLKYQSRVYSLTR